MIEDRWPVPGRRAALAGLLLAVAAYLPHLLALAVRPTDHATTTLTAVAGTCLLANGVGTAVYGLARVLGHVRDLHERLAQALTDPVTGLPVRRIAEDTLAATDPAVVVT